MIRSHTGTPKSYLNLFTRKQSPADRKPGLWVYQRGLPPFKSTPYSVGKEKGYFAITKPDGSRDESLENILSAFEGTGAELLRRLNFETYVMSPRDEETLDGYIALTFARTSARRGLTAKIFDSIRDAYQELAVDSDWLQDQVTAYQRFSGVLTSPGEISKAFERVLQKLAKPEQANNGFVQGLLRVAEGIFRELQGKPWQIWEAPEPSQFITTDNPVVTLKSDTWGTFSPGWGFRTPGATAAFPISPRCCVVVGEGVGTGRRYWRRATPRDVNGINQALVMCMDRWAYSATRSEDIEWLVNHLGGSVRYGVNAFVPSWMSNAPDHIKAKVRDVLGPKRDQDRAAIVQAKNRRNQFRSA
jgi:hypothetical protein